MGVIDEVDVVGLKVAVLKTAMELDVFTNMPEDTIFWKKSLPSSSVV